MARVTKIAITVGLATIATLPAANHSHTLRPAGHTVATQADDNPSDARFAGGTDTEPTPSDITTASIEPLGYVGRPGDRSPWAAALEPFTAARDLLVLKSGLDALGAGDIEAARAIRDGLAASDLDREILSWSIAISGSAEVGSAEIAAVRTSMRDWPGEKLLARNAERATVRDTTDPATLLAVLGGSAPDTVQGAISLARAHLALDNPDAAHAVLAPFWRQERLEASDEASVIKEFGTVLTEADHRARMEAMFYANRVRSALRIAHRAGAGELAAAWSAVLGNEKNAAKLLAAVPAAQRSAGYAFAEAKYLRRKQRFKEAADIILAAPRDAAALIDPDAWWLERRVLSRELVDAGDMATAYKLVSQHSAESPLNAADAEFHAGWYALRGLGDAKAAAEHFNRIITVADGAIGLSRAHYWLGRAIDAGAAGDAAASYRKAATYPTAFYGQLAAAKLGLPIVLTSPRPSEAERRDFQSRQPVRALLRLESAGYPERAAMLYRELALSLSQPGDLALLAAIAESKGNHYTALRVAKAAASRGIDVGDLTHPVGAIPSTANMSDAGTALAYAIARQESEFNVGAVSGAGALGLLQLLPGTAQEMARKIGVAYSRPRLTADPGYNATLGSAFLSEQLGRFTGSYILTFAGYNAGPRRAQEWIKRYGDPRGKDIDTVVDWIERIPYAETRSYVQRVMENYQIYKTRLTGSSDLAADLVKGRS